MAPSNPSCQQVKLLGWLWERKEKKETERVVTVWCHNNINSLGHRTVCPRIWEHSRVHRQLKTATKHFYKCCCASSICIVRNMSKRVDPLPFCFISGTNNYILHCFLQWWLLMDHCRQWSFPKVNSVIFCCLHYHHLAADGCSFVLSYK